MDKIVPAFETTLFDPTLSDACIDMAELGIDSLLDEGVFKSIPIVSVLVGLGKAAQNIHDRNLLKQTIKFINTFNEKSISVQNANSHFLRTAGPHFPDSPGHIKRTAWDISRAEGTPPH